MLGRRFHSYVNQKHGNNNAQTNQIKELELIESTDTILRGTFNNGTSFQLHIPRNDEGILTTIRENVPNFKVNPAQTFWSQMFISLLPVVLIIGFIWYLSYRGSQVGNKLWTFGKSRAKMTGKGGSITFKDVAGVDEAKEELQEIIEF